MNTVTPRCDQVEPEPPIVDMRRQGCLYPALLLIALFVFWWLA